jgi:hypothetical protein
MAIRRFSTLALLVVWWIAAAASFTHIRDLAAAHQQDGWVAWAIAISLELVVAMAALEILRDSRVGHRSIAPWLVLLTGAGLVLATNLASAEPAPWGWVLAGWPAVASMAATKLFVRRLRHAAEDDDASLQPPFPASWLGREPSVPAASASLNGVDPPLRLPPGPDRQADSDPADLARLRDHARKLYIESVAGGVPLTGAQLGAACGMGARWGRQRIAEARRGESEVRSRDGRTIDHQMRRGHNAN